MPASNPLRPAYVQRDLSHLPASSSPLELFQITTASPAWILGVDPLPPLHPHPPVPSPHLRNVWLISIPTLVSCQKATFSASVAMGHRKLPQEDRGTWTPRWLLQLSTPCVHLDGFPAPLAGAPTQAPVPDNLLLVSLLGTCPHLSLHKVIS